MPSGSRSRPEVGLPLGPLCQQRTFRFRLTAPFAVLDDERNDGAESPDGRVIGTYCHGLLAAPHLRGALLQRIGAEGNGLDHDKLVDDALDDLASALEAHLDVDGLLRIANERGQ